MELIYHITINIKLFLNFPHLLIWFVFYAFTSFSIILQTICVYIIL